MRATPKTAVLEELPPPLRPVVAPLKRWAFGLAIALPVAVGVGGFALFHALWAPDAPGVSGIGLLSHNFLPGYEPTVAGAAVGAVWGLVWGFALGWLAAAARDVVLWVSMQVIAWRQRARAAGSALDELL